MKNAVAENADEDRFHLSLPVARFDECLDFYRTCFDARVEPLGVSAANVHVFDAQLTLHDRPASPLTDAARQEMHFGYVVSREAWWEIDGRLRSLGHRPIRRSEPGSPGARGKLVVRDPSGNLVEINSRVTG